MHVKKFMAFIVVVSFLFLHANLLAAKESSQTNINTTAKKPIKQRIVKKVPKKDVKKKPSPISKCEKETSRVGRAMCYSEKAIEKKDVSICTKYLKNEEGYDFRDLCYRDFAIVEKNKGVCSKIVSARLKDQCTMVLTKQQQEKEKVPIARKKADHYEDCGVSDSCFSKYVKTCTPAKATVSDQGTTYIETVEGIDSSSCLITLIYTVIPLSDMRGKELICRVPKSNLKNFKEYLQGKRMKQSCEGPLMDFLIKKEKTL